MRESTSRGLGMLDGVDSRLPGVSRGSRRAGLPIVLVVLALGALLPTAGHAKVTGSAKWSGDGQAAGARAGERAGFRPNRTHVVVSRRTPGPHGERYRTVPIGDLERALREEGYTPDEIATIRVGVVHPKDDRHERVSSEQLREAAAVLVAAGLRPGKLDSAAVEMHDRELKTNGEAEADPADAAAREPNWLDRLLRRDPRARKVAAARGEGESADMAHEIATRWLPAAAMVGVSFVTLGVGEVTAAVLAGALGYWGKEAVSGTAWAVKSIAKSFVVPNEVELIGGVLNKYLLGLVPAVGIFAAAYAGSPMLFLAAVGFEAFQATIWGPFIATMRGGINRMEKEGGAKATGAFFFWNGVIAMSVQRLFGHLANPETVSGPWGLDFLGSLFVNNMVGSVFGGMAPRGLGQLEAKGVISRGTASGLQQINDWFFMLKMATLGVGWMPAFWTLMGTEIVYQCGLGLAGKLARERPRLFVGTEEALASAKVLESLHFTPQPASAAELQAQYVRQMLREGLAFPKQILWDFPNDISGGRLNQGAARAKSAYDDWVRSLQKSWEDRKRRAAAAGAAAAGAGI